MTDREKLIELLIKDPCYFEFGSCGTCTYHKEPACFPPRMADHLLAHGVTFAKDTDVPSKWISVEDGLPENGVWVLAYQDVGWTGVAQIEEDGWHWYTQDLIKISDPTHWMPLPEPPKE